MKNKIYVPGEEFIRKIIQGERYFLGIKLQEDFDLSGHEKFPILNKSLENTDRLRLYGSDFIGIKAKGILLRKLEGADTNFSRSDFTGANLQNANFQEADMAYALLGDANLDGTNFYKTILSRANFCGAQNLQKTRDLGTAICKQPIIVTPTENAIIQLIRMAEA